MTDIEERIIEQSEIVGAVTMYRYIDQLKKNDEVKEVNFVYMTHAQFDTFWHNWSGYKGVSNVQLKDTIIGETIKDVYFKFIKGAFFTDEDKEKLERTILTGEIKVIKQINYRSR